MGAKSGVMRDIPPGSVYLGAPATPEPEQMVQLAALSRLPAMRKQLKSLQRQVEQLTYALAAQAKEDVA